MKYRTAVEFSRDLDSQFTKRSRELLALRAQIEIGDDQGLSRAGVVMAYAHWEGFLKWVVDAYLTYAGEYTQRHSIAGSRIVPLIIAVWFWKRAGLNGDRGLLPFLAEVSACLPEVYGNLRLALSDAVKFDANVSTTTFRKIAFILGIDYQKYAMREKFIDERICASRHKIAHGEMLIVEPDDAVEVIDGVLDMLGSIKIEVLERASNKKFLNA